MIDRIRLAIWFSIIVLVAAIHGIPAQAQGTFGTAVTIKYGKLKGYVSGDAIVWKGVPYAKPPVGDLRWKAPQDAEPWDGVRDAVFPAKKSTQLLTTREWIRTEDLDEDSSEDCLYVDIYRPSHTGKLPVYVWIHGGSNNFGSARDYDGTHIAVSSNLVVVAAQYRLGPIGWFYHPAIQKEGADKLSNSGNFGTLDLIQVLKWINKNIAAFGGDHDNVTITGESAGAHNVMNMVISPLGKGLFKQAMSESGGMVTVTADSARVSANGYIEKVIRLKEGVDTATAVTRRITMERNGALEAYLRSTAAGDFFLALYKYGPVPVFPGIEDNFVIPIGGWMPAIKAGNYNKVPIILGSNEYESKPFMPLYGPRFKKSYGIPSGSYTWFNLINVLRKDMPVTVDSVLVSQNDKHLYELTGYFGSRNWKAKYVDTVARELAKVQDHVYAYFFKWGGIGSGPPPFDFIYGAGHGAEVSFFFGDDQGLFGYPFVPANEAGRKDLQAAMMAYLSNFAYTGNPNSPSSDMPKWEKWSNVQGGPKAIVFDADFNQARIGMMTEELTIEGVTAELNTVIRTLPENEQSVASFFQFSKPW